MRGGGGGGTLIGSLIGSTAGAVVGGAQAHSRWERSAAELRAALQEPLELHGRRRQHSTACRLPLEYPLAAARNN